VTARLPLRTKLVAVLATLLVVALTGAGAASVAALRGYLVDQVDGQLRSVANASADHREGIVQPDTGPGRDEGRPAPPSDFYVRYADTTGTPLAVVANPLADETATPVLPEWSLDRVRAQGAQPFTTGSSDGRTRWRAVASPLRDGTGSVTVAQSLRSVDATVARLVGVQVAVGLAVLVLLGLLARVLVRRSLQPLEQVERTAGAIAAGDLSRRVPEADPRTEVGSLARSFNGMVDRIEESFRAQGESEAAAVESERRMRRFVADASHELRTPLTTIRGFAELYRQGAVVDPHGLDRSMGRIESEAARMGLLVDDLLMLARLDQHRPLAEAPVDLLVLASDAVHDARVAEPDREVSLRVESGEEPPIVRGDEAALRQVLGNLVSNALRHTPAGTPVTVRLGTRPESAAAVLEVGDRGPGLAPEAAARVFERFYRADDARGRAQGGTGLGLAIVASIVEAHGGSVELDTAVGRGARFSVLLPLA